VLPMVLASAADGACKCCLWCLQVLPMVLASAAYRVTVLAVLLLYRDPKP